MHKSSYKVIEFILSFQESDTRLIDTLIEGYLTIFESFDKVSNSVFKAYEELLDTKELPVKIKDKHGIYVYRTITHIDGTEVPIIFRDGHGDKGEDDVAGYADYNKDIEIIHSIVPHMIVNNGLRGYINILHNPTIKHVLMHELAHVYEFNNRDSKVLHNQINALNSPNNPYLSNSKKHINHNIERLAHKVSIVSGIIEAMYNKMTNESDIIKYLINTLPYKEFIDKLSPKNKHTLLLRISALIHKILNREVPELNDTIDRIRGK
jgi:hypothetical protein